MPDPDANLITRPSRSLDLTAWAAAIAWFLAARELAARSATGISQRLDLYAVQPALRAMFLVFLLGVGFYLLEAIGHNKEKSVRGLLGLPQRATALEEFGIGAAIGWGALLLAILPIAAGAVLEVQLWTEMHGFVVLAGTLVGVVFSTLAQELVFRGFAFRHLIRAVGPVGATLAMSMLYGLLAAFQPHSTGMGVLVVSLLGLVLCLGWLRTHGLWFSWGLNLGWTASMGVLFGLPVAGATDLSSVVQIHAVGSRWLTGGEFGPEGALFSFLALLVAMAAVVRTTREYAWEYTQPVLVPAGYPMDVAPPPAHVEMENRAAAAPPPLVQILPTTPQQRSAGDPPR